MDGISVQDTIVKIDSDSSHVFFAHDGFFGSPLPSGFHRVLELVHVLDSLGGINQSVGSGVFWSKVPQFVSTVVFVPVVVLSQILGSDFGIIFGSDLRVLDIHG